MPTFIGGSVANRVTAGGVGFGPNGSVFLDAGAAEFLGNLTSGFLGISNDWSISIWTKPNGDAIAGGTIDTFGVANAGLDQSNLIRMVYNVVHYAVLTQDPDGSILKLYRWADAIASDVWQNHILTWDGAALILAYQGLEVAPSEISIDNLGAMTDTERKIIIGARPSEDPPDTNRYTGHLGHIGVWTEALDTSDFAEIFAGKHAIDLRNNSGGYDKSASLVHYYRPGYDSQGREDLVAGAFVNNLDDSTTTDANIVEDAPA